MQLSSDEVRMISSLAKLQLTDEEVEKFTGELSSILTHMDVFDDLDTTGVRRMIQGSLQENVFVGDEIELCDIEKDLVACTPHEVEDNMVSIPRIM